MRLPTWASIVVIWLATAGAVSAETPWVLWHKVQTAGGVNPIYQRGEPFESKRLCEADRDKLWKQLDTAANVAGEQRERTWHTTSLGPNRETVVTMHVLKCWPVGMTPQ
jgi:hypothetical protein